MRDHPDDDVLTARLLTKQKRDWQLWSLLIFGICLIGTGLSVYGFVRLHAAANPSFSELLPPILYATFSLLALGTFYLAQREAVLEGVHHELIRQKIEAELNRELALLDPVTEVYNRRYVRVIMKREISRAQRYKKGLSVMMIDITGFRRVNDSLGQAGGDVVLRQVAHVLKLHVRNSDLIVRFGGDEFLLILPDSEPQGIELLRDRLRAALDHWSRSSGLDEFTLSFAIGVAHYSSDRRADEILSQAEQRMLQDRRATSNAPVPKIAVAETS